MVNQLMAVTFPSSPTLGDQYTIGQRVYEYDGSAWFLISNIVLSKYVIDGGDPTIVQFYVQTAPVDGGGV